VGQLALVEVGDGGVDGGLRDAHVHGRVARHHPVRHELRDQQRQPFHAAEQGVGRYGHVEVYVVRGGGAHAQRVPGGLDGDAGRPGRNEELRHRRRVGGAAGGHQVAVGVPGPGHERLGALDPVPAVLGTVLSGQLGQPRSDATFAHRDRVPAALGGGGQQPVAGGQEALGYAQGVDQGRRDAGEGTGDRGVHVVDQRGRPVAAGQFVGDGRVLGEPGPEPAQPRRHHQPEQAGVPQVGEVVDREVAGAVVPAGAGGEAGRQPAGGGEGIAHAVSLVPTAW
jgi:hypothetical protein